MAPRITLRHLPYDRTKIKVGVLLEMLEAHAIGRRKMDASQVRAAEILLKKVLPDLAAIEHSGETTENVHYYAEIPEKAKTTEEWLAGNPITSPAKPKLGGQKGPKLN